MNKRVPNVGTAGLLQNCGDGSGTENSPLVQNHKIIVRCNLVDQVCRPKHPNTRFNKLPHMSQNIGPGVDVETNCRLVQKQQLWSVQQSPRDLDASHLPNRKL